MLRWGIQILEVLNHLHTRQPPIIHRDIKPQNLKLNERGDIVLLDFGLAKDMVEGTVLYGYTRHYSPPEQINYRSTDARSDLYSLAATLYHLMTGEFPPDAVERTQIVANGQPDPLRPVNEVNTRVPSAIASVLMRALILSRDKRFASASEMSEALLAISKNHPQNTVVAHVLAIETARFTERRTDEEDFAAKHLDGVVKETATFKRELGREQLFYRLTREGGTIVFFGDLEAPVNCALEIVRALKAHPGADLRMGINAGPVQQELLNGSIHNVFGPGIKIAKDVLRCGDARHILLSKTMADYLGEDSDWSKHLTEFGEYEVDSGMSVGIFNLYKNDEGLGNPNPTTKQPLFPPDPTSSRDGRLSPSSPSPQLPQSPHPSHSPGMKWAARAARSMK